MDDGKKRRRIADEPRAMRPPDYPSISRVREIPDDVALTKQCPSCLEVLSWEYFGIDVRRRSRLDTYCNYCRSHYWPRVTRSKSKKRAKVIDEELSTTLPYIASQPVVTAIAPQVEPIVTVTPRPEPLPLPAMRSLPAVDVPADTSDELSTSSYSIDSILDAIPLWEFPLPGFETMSADYDTPLTELTQL